MPVFICYGSVIQELSYIIEKSNGIFSELAKHRIKCFVISSPEEITSYLSEYKDEPSVIIFITISDEDRQSLFDHYSEFNFHKIVFSNTNVNTAYSNFSSITSNFYDDMENAISHLREKGCKNIALFNANPDGNHDRIRISTYEQLIYHTPLIFYKSKSFLHNILNLLRSNERIDAIICNNDYTAFRLMLILDAVDADWNEKLLVLSFSNTILSSLHNPSLSSVSLNYTTAGKRIATIYNLIKKDDQIAYIHLTMKNELFARETTRKNNPKGIIFSEQCSLDNKDVFEIDKQSNKCMALEKILLSCNFNALKIIHGLLLSKNVSEMSSDLYLHTESIKYHIKKLKSVLNCRTTAEVAAFLKTWIDPDKLKKVIIDYGTFSNYRK